MSDRDFHMLLVEDDDAHAALLCRAIRESDPHVTVERERDGRAALTRLQSAEQPAPDLILLDLKLPGLSGLDILEAIRNNQALSSTPVLILSASAAHNHLREAYALHANAYLVKPLEFSQLRAMAASIVTFWRDHCRPAPVAAAG